jgi:hypothetical protein
MLQTGLRVGEVAALSIAKTAPQRAHLSQSRQAPGVTHRVDQEIQHMLENAHLLAKAA